LSISFLAYAALHTLLPSLPLPHVIACPERFNQRVARLILINLFSNLEKEEGWRADGMLRAAAKGKIDR
jgi:hypothetical protein